ncbi:MAG TPA: glycoside hydrolase domain-containing protein [Puia sp.]|jgi:hypothetical protein
MQKYCLSITLLLILWAGAADAQKTTSSLRIQGDSLISFWGRRVLLSHQGFPQQITTFFTADGKDTTGSPTNILAENIHFHFTGLADGKDIRLKSGPIRFTDRSANSMAWQVTSSAEGLAMEVTGNLGANGLLQYTVRVTALQDLDMKEIVMHIPFEKDAAKYAIGLGLKGEYHPDSLYHWKWNPGITDQPDGAWVGSDDTGLRYSLLDLPHWINDGKGGIDIGNKGKSMLVSNYSGPRKLQKGDVLYFNFSLKITGGKSARGLSR